MGVSIRPSDFVEEGDCWRMVQPKLITKPTTDVGLSLQAFPLDEATLEPVVVQLGEQYELVVGGSKI